MHGWNDYWAEEKMGKAKDEVPRFRGPGGQVDGSLDAQLERLLASGKDTANKHKTRSPNSGDPENRWMDGRCTDETTDGQRRRKTDKAKDEVPRFRGPGG